MPSRPLQYELIHSQDILQSLGNGWSDGPRTEEGCRASDVRLYCDNDDRWELVTIRDTFMWGDDSNGVAIRVDTIKLRRCRKASTFASTYYGRLARRNGENPRYCTISICNEKFNNIERRRLLWSFSLHLATGFIGSMIRRCLCYTPDFTRYQSTILLSSYLELLRAKFAHHTFWKTSLLTCRSSLVDAYNAIPHG